MRREIIGEFCCQCRGLTPYPIKDWGYVAEYRPCPYCGHNKTCGHCGLEYRETFTARDSGPYAFVGTGGGSSNG